MAARPIADIRFLLFDSRWQLWSNLRNCSRTPGRLGQAFGPCAAGAAAL